MRPTRPPRPARRARTLAAALLCAVLCLGQPAACGPGAEPDAGDGLSLAAASSLRDLLERTLPEFRPAGRALDLRVSYAASSTLSRQIEEGARFDVFLSADAFNLDRLGPLVDSSTRRVFLGNTLVLVGRAGLEPPPADPAALAGRPLSVALAGPAVPAGRYARAWLEQAGLLAALESRLVVADSVRATLALVESGAADCGFVYLTDARAARHAQLLWSAPPGAGARAGTSAGTSAGQGSGAEIAYVAAALGASTSPWADAFLDWLGGETCLAAALEAGFLPPPAGG